MDHLWLNELDQHTAVLVPTRSLANALNEQVAHLNITQGVAVWEAPTILVWADYLRLLWQVNRDVLSAVSNASTLISNQQSLLLWTQVIEASRRQERELTLLNVQQTARAAQRSWRLMSDWGVTAEHLSQDHVADTEQFLLWLDAYQGQLQKRAVLDDAGLVALLCQQKGIGFVHKRVVWYAYDLETAAQRALNARATQLGVDIELRQPPSKNTDIEYAVYNDSKHELIDVFSRARRLLEQDSTARINVVIPDLQRRYAQVRELARHVFYPAASPLSVQQNNTAYRFSLGQPLNEWAAIETALSLIALLKNRCTVSELSFILRNQFLRLTKEFTEPCRGFEMWLKNQRMRQLLFDNLPSLHIEYLESISQKSDGHFATQTSLNSEFTARLTALVEQRQTLQTRLSQARESKDRERAGFATLSFSQWATVYHDWLGAWGWQTTRVDSDMNTVQYQLQQRWYSLLEEFAALFTVQHQIGLKRAIEVMEQMSRDAIFLPKAAASPIIISSVFEAIGRPVDVCFLTGMNQDYPVVPKPDAFVPNRLLLESGHPDITADTAFQQAKKVNQSLLRCAKKAWVSYARFNGQDTQLRQQVCAIYRNNNFTEIPVTQPQTSSVVLQAYVDEQGPAWSDAGRARGGSKIFENQSHCEFKAFITHQLGFQSDDEAQFGLDSLDRGNVVHRVLDLLWGELQTQQNLLDKTSAELDLIIDRAVTHTLEDETLQLNTEKRTLLQYERPRLLSLLTNWLAIEARRPEHFSVVEREEVRHGQCAGIKFKFIVDRLDMTDDGRSFIIDYKTGAVNRKDWIGERIRSPQMPLYAVALDTIKNKPVSGIAYAKVNQNKPEFVELGEANVLKKGKGHELVWQENRPAWDVVFEQLAQDFLSGKAKVNPIDEKACQYCDLRAVCRVSQLRDNALDMATELTRGFADDQ